MNINAAHGQNNPLDIAALKADRCRQASAVKSNAAEGPQPPVPPAPGAPGAPGGVNGRSAGEFSYTNRDLQHLLVDWGVSNSPYDITGDGTVDVTDMLEMLSNIGGKGTPWTPALAGDPSTLPMNQNTLDHLMIDWGQTSSQYDVTGDGTVNVTDLMYVIGNWDSSSGGSPIVRQPGEMPAIQQYANQTAPPMTVVEPPLAAEPTPSGDAGSEATPTTTASANSQNPEQPVAPVVATAAPAEPAQLAPAKLNRLRAAIIERLSGEGFASRPPINIRELVAKLNLAPTDRKALLAQLREHYANGLGVNFKA